MMKCTCDICGKVICRAPFGEFVKTIRDESNSRTTLIIKARSKDGSYANFEDVCCECTDGILAFVESRKDEHK